MLILRLCANSGYDAVAQQYEAGRPEYPSETIQELLVGVSYAPGKVICDLGAGTGKLTKAILDCHPQANIVAVEPSQEMCAVFSQQLPVVPIRQGSAEAIPLPDASVDSVVVGTAFHWFATPEALREIVRILKPGGSLGLIWNVFDTTVPWVAQVRALLDPYRVESELFCNHDSLRWQTVFSVCPLFNPLVHATRKYAYTGTCKNILQRVASSKAYGMLSSQKQEEINQGVVEIVQQQARVDGSINIPYRIEIYWAEKVPLVLAEE